MTNNLKNLQKKIIKIESRTNLICKNNFIKKINKINKYELDIFYKKFNQYKIITKIIFDYPYFYSELKSIQLDEDSNTNVNIYNQIIWIHEHYEFIENIRKTESDIEILLNKSYNSGLITFIQYKLSKKILKKIDLIYKSDIILYDFYHKNNISNEDDLHYKNQFEHKKIFIENNLINSQLDFFFDIIEIIFLQIYNIMNKKIKYNKNYILENLSNNNKYFNKISKLKKYLII